MNKKITETLLGLIYDMADTGLDIGVPTGASLEACREVAALLKDSDPKTAGEFTALGNDIEAVMNSY
jgi:hypothetical protein